MKKQTLLWRIEGEGLPGSSFLFGTMHVRDSRFFDGIDFVCEKINSCDAFAAEFHIDEASLESMGGMRSQLPENQTLQHLIPPGKFEKIRKILLKSAGLDICFFQNMPPFFITGLVAERILVNDMPMSLDEHLWNFAKSHDKSLHGVETYSEQLEVLKNISIDDQVKMLMDLARNVSRYRKHLLHLADLYKKNDLKRLFKNVKKNAKGLRKIMLYRRNEIMAERIADLVFQQTTFAAIGAAHLAGGKGVIKLLKMKGLKLCPVKR